MSWKLECVHHVHVTLGFAAHWQCWHEFQCLGQDIKMSACLVVNLVILVSNQSDFQASQMVYNMFWWQ